MNADLLSTIALARLAVFGAALALLVLYDVREHHPQPHRPTRSRGVRSPLPRRRRATQHRHARRAPPSPCCCSASASSGPPCSAWATSLTLLILCALDSVTALALLITLELYALVALILLGRHGRAALTKSLPVVPIAAQLPA